LYFQWYWSTSNRPHNWIVIHIRHGPLRRQEAAVWWILDRTRTFITYSKHCFMPPSLRPKNSIFSRTLSNPAPQGGVLWRAPRKACATRLCSHTFSVGLILEPREGWIVTSSMLTSRQTNRPKRPLTSICMEATYKCRLLGLSLLLADFAHM